MLDDPLAPIPVSWLGDLVTTRRRELGYSQRDLAERVCAVTGRATVTRHEISRFERETRIPTPATLTGLATALDLPATWLGHAAAVTRFRRRLTTDHPDQDPYPTPGTLIRTGDDQPHPMVLLGVPPHPDHTDPPGHPPPNPDRTPRVTGH